MRTWETKRHQKFNFSLVYLELDGVSIHRYGLLLRKCGTQAFSNTFQEEGAGESCMCKPGDRSTYPTWGRCVFITFQAESYRRSYWLGCEWATLLCLCHDSAAHFFCLSGKDVADRWYSEIKNYSFQNPGFSSRTGKFRLGAVTSKMKFLLLC